MNFRRWFARNGNKANSNLSRRNTRPKRKSPIALEPLEQRLMLDADPFTFTVSDGEQLDHTLRLYDDGTNAPLVQLIDNTDQDIIAEQSQAYTTEIIITGADQNDRLIVDANQDYYIPIVFDGSEGFDTLEVVNGLINSNQDNQSSIMLNIDNIVTLQDISVEEILLDNSHANFAPPAGTETEIKSIDRWWAYENSEPFEVVLDVSIGVSGDYQLDINTANHDDWKLKSGSTLTIKQDNLVVFSGEFDTNWGTIDIFNLDKGSYSFIIDSFQPPNKTIVEGVNFVLSQYFIVNGRPQRIPVDILETNFISDNLQLTDDSISGKLFGDGFSSVFETVVGGISGLLEKYAPVIWFNAGERYSPVDVNDVLSMPDVTVTSGSSTYTSNETELIKVIGGIGDVNAVIDFPKESPKDFLGVYTESGTNKIYGSVIPQYDGSTLDELALNYWFYYPYSNWKMHGGYNNHEGDWEGITVFLQKIDDPEQNLYEPYAVGYAQHENLIDNIPQLDGGEVVSWTTAAVAKTSTPNVFVGLGGHASYFDLGIDTWITPNILDNEIHVGDNVDYLVPNNYGIHVLDRAPILGQSKNDQWTLFGGHWGQLDLDGLIQFGDNGPHGLVYQERWLDPWSWTEGFVEDLNNQVERGGWGDGSVLDKGEWTIITHGLLGDRYTDLIYPDFPVSDPDKPEKDLTITSSNYGNDSFWRLAQKIWHESLEKGINGLESNIAIHRMYLNANSFDTIISKGISGWHQDLFGKNDGWFFADSKGIDIDDPDFHHILLFNWGEVSNYIDPNRWPYTLDEILDLFGLGLLETPPSDASGEDGYTEASADFLYGLLMGYGIKNVNTLIGHSRGAVVMTELAQRLLIDGDDETDVKHIIFLDAEGGGHYRKHSGWVEWNVIVPEQHVKLYEDEEFWAWEGIITDNYYSSFNDKDPILGMRVDLGGHNVDGTRNYDAHPEYSHNGLLLFLRPGMQDYLTYEMFIKDEHIITPDTPENTTGNPKELSHDPPVMTDTEYELFNGDFAFNSTAGWWYHGGGFVSHYDGNLYIPGTVENNKLILQSGQSRKHNHFYLPSNADALNFDVESILTGLGDKLTVIYQYWYPDNRSATLEKSFEVTDFSTGHVSLEIPKICRGTVGTLSFCFINENNQVYNTIAVDNIQFGLDPSPEPEKPNPPVEENQWKLIMQDFIDPAYSIADRMANNDAVDNIIDILLSSDADWMSIDSLSISSKVGEFLVENIGGTPGSENLRASIEVDVTYKVGLTLYEVIPTEEGFEIIETPETAYGYGKGKSSDEGEDINHVVVEGTNKDDRIRLDGVWSTSKIYGNDDVDNINLSSSTGASIVYGGQGADIINGTSNADKIYGQGEADTINGEGGKDYIEGGAGADIINGGGGTDTIHGGDGDDTIKGGDAKDYIFGEGDNDTIEGQGGDDEIKGGPGVDTISGGTGEDLIYGGIGADIIDGGGDKDLIFGEEGDDTIKGGSGNDLLYGGPNSDYINGEGGDDHIFGNEGSDKKEHNGLRGLVGGSGIDIIFGDSATITEPPSGNNGPKWTDDGGSGDDEIHGGANQDWIYGQDGDDIIFGDGGADRIFGQEDDDIINGGEDQDVILGDGGEIYTDGTVRLTSSYIGNDTISGGGDKDYIYGQYGVDTIYGEDASNPSTGGGDYIEGNQGKDTIRGNGGNDTLKGNSGNDRIFGNAGTDTIYGHTGNDILVGDDGSLNGNTVKAEADGSRDYVYGMEGSDIIAGGGGADVLIGDNLENGNPINQEDWGTDIILGDGGTVDSSNRTVTGSDTGDADDDDLIEGNQLSDILHGGKGEDQIYGHDGEDLIHGDGGHDIILGDNGTITEGIGGDANGVGDGDIPKIDWEVAGVSVMNDGENDTIYGGGGNDWIYAQGGDDDVDGNGDNDRIFGHSGQDTLRGGANEDIIFGENGRVSVFGPEALATPEPINEPYPILPKTIPNPIGLDDGIYGDNIYGDAGDDELFGNEHDDWIEGGEDNDTIYGGDGPDMLMGDGPDTPSGNGNDVVYGQAGKDYLYGGLGDDRLDGGTEADHLLGDKDGPNDGTDVFSAGEGGQDVLIADFESEPDTTCDDTTHKYAYHDCLDGEGNSDTYIITHAVFDDDTLDSLIRVYDSGTVDSGTDLLKVNGTAYDEQFLLRAANEAATVRIAADETTDNETLDDLVADINRAIDQAGIIHVTAEMEDGPSPRLILRGDSDAAITSLRLKPLGDYPLGILGFTPDGQTAEINDMDIKILAESAIDKFAFEDDIVFRLEVDFGLAFVAKVKLDEEGNSVLAERVNYFSLERVQVSGLLGDDRFAVDDVRAEATLNGGQGDDFFQFAQLYKSKRTQGLAGIADPWDEFRTIHTSQGWLSNGITQALTANGGNGDDMFVVFHNLAVLSLNGNDGDDTFIVKAMALYGSDDAVRGRTDISGGEGSNLIQYVINAPVYIDGGDGQDRVVILGTEFSDDFIITKEGVFGAGLHVEFENIEELEIDGAEGDDRFFVQSTSSEFATLISGGLGSDSFFMAGDVPEVVSNSLLGHSGLITHSIENNGSVYDEEVFIDGVTARVADNDSAGVRVSAIDHLDITEGGSAATYKVVLTKAPTHNVLVRALAPVQSPQDEERKARMFGINNGQEDPQKQNPNDPHDETSMILTFTPDNWDKPQEVHVHANGLYNDVEIEGPRVGHVHHTVTSEDPNYKGLALTRVEVRVHDDDAAGLVIGEVDETGTPDLNTTVIEGDDGNDLLMVSLTKEPTEDTEVTVLSKKGEEGELMFFTDSNSPSAQATIVFTSEDWSVPKSLYVAALDDSANEGFQLDWIEFAVLGQSDTSQSAGTETHILMDDPETYVGPQVNYVGKPQAYLGLSHIPDSTFISIKRDGSLLTEEVDYHIQSNKVVFSAPPTDAPITRSGKFEVTYNYSIPGYKGLRIDPLPCRVADDDAPGVLIRQTDNSTEVIETSDTAKTKAPWTDTYKVRLTKDPQEEVVVVVRPEKSKVSPGVFDRQVIVTTDALGAEHGEDELGNPILKLRFDSNGTNKWNIEQTVTVTAIDDDYVEGQAGQISMTDPLTRLVPYYYPETVRFDVTEIQGPVFIDGFRIGEINVSTVPVLLPGETNIKPSDGIVMRADEDEVTVHLHSLGEYELDHLKGMAIEITKGTGADQWPPFRIIQDYKRDKALSLVTLTLNKAWETIPDTTSEFAITKYSSNFFVDEADQVDFLFLFHEGSQLDAFGGMKEFSSALYPDSEVAKKFDNELYEDAADGIHIYGLGMPKDVEIGDVDPVLQPGGVVYANLEVAELNLGSANEVFVVEKTHAREDFQNWTMINTGSGDDVVLISATENDGDLAVNTEKGNDYVLAGSAKLEYIEEEGALLINTPVLEKQKITPRKGDYVSGEEVIKLDNPTTQELVIFGGEGVDHIEGSIAGDIIFGDRGQIDYYDEAGRLVTRLGADRVEYHGKVANATNQTTDPDTAIMEVQHPIVKEYSFLQKESEVGGFPLMERGLMGLPLQITNGPGFDYRGELYIQSNTEDTLGLIGIWNPENIPDITSTYRIPYLPEDQTDGEVRPPTVAFSTFTDTGGDDVIHSGLGLDFVVGGQGNDTITTGGDGVEKDTVIGDNGRHTFGGSETFDPGEESAIVSFNFMHVLDETVVDDKAGAPGVEAEEWINLEGGGHDTYGDDPEEIVRFDDGRIAPEITIEWAQNLHAEPPYAPVPAQPVRHTGINPGDDQDLRLFSGYLSAGLLDTLDVTLSGMSGHFESYDMYVYLDAYNGLDAQAAYTSTLGLDQEPAVRQISIGETDFYLSDPNGHTFTGEYELVNSTDQENPEIGNYVVFKDLSEDVISLQIKDPHEDRWIERDAPMISGIQILGRFHPIDRIETINAEYGGNDTIITGDGPDLVLGGTGDDHIDTFGPALQGWQDGDRVVGDNGRVTVMLDEIRRIDTVDASYGGNDDVRSGNGRDLVIGGSQDDTIDSGVEDEPAEDPNDQDIYDHGDIQVISLNFNSGTEGGEVHGIAGAVQVDNWNNLAGRGPKKFGLIDTEVIQDNNENELNNVKVAWGTEVREGFLRQASEDSHDQLENPGSQNERLFKGYLSADQHHPLTVIVEGLEVLNQSYDVYVYLDSDDERNVDSAVKVSVDGTSFYVSDPSGENFQGEFVEVTAVSADQAQVGNVVVFRDLSLNELKIQVEKLVSPLVRMASIPGISAIQIVAGPDRGRIVMGGDRDQDIILGDGGSAYLFDSRIVEVITDPPGMGHEQTDLDRTVSDIQINGNDSIKGGDNTDIIIGGLGADKIDGQAGHDALMGDEARATIYQHQVIGLDTNESWFVGIDPYALAGVTLFNPTQGGDDKLYGGTGDDLIYGQGGSDTYIFNSFINLGTERDDDCVITKDDINRTGLGRDRLVEAGGDIADGQPNDDHDELDFSNFGDSVFVKLYQSRAQVVNPNWMMGEFGLGLTLFSEDAFEDVNGSGYDDRIRGNIRENKLLGNGGRDLILGMDGDDKIYGGCDADRLYGGEGNDEIRGGGGEDQLYGHSGDDVLYGDGENDTLDGGGGDDLLAGGTGNDSIKGGGRAMEDTDLIFFPDAKNGVKVELNVTGGTSNDHPENVNTPVEYKLGKDTLDYTIEGAIGTDFDDELIAIVSSIRHPARSRTDKSDWGVTFYGMGGKDMIVGSIGNDYLYGGSSKAKEDYLEIQIIQDQIDEDDGDIIIGGSGNDILEGNQGRDILIGDKGRDTLQGGASQDILIGGYILFSSGINGNGVPDPATLWAIYDEWNSSRSQAKRRKNLTDTDPTPDRQNNGYFLLPIHPGQTAFDDGDDDMLDGGPGNDWLWPLT